MISPSHPLRPVVLVHGVGVGARSMGRLAASLERAGRRVVVLDRPGYGRGSSPSPVDDQAAWLVDSCGEVASEVDLIGVSGGATVALAALCLDSSVVGRAILHEPLVGPLSPRLHAAIASSAASLALDPSTDALLAFIRRLIGIETMEHLDAGVVDDLVRSERTVRAEVPSFAAFAPDLDRLGALADVAADVVITVGGARDALERHDAAAVLARVAGASTLVLTGAGHLAQVDDPDALADVLLDAPVTTPCGPATERGTC